MGNTCTVILSSLYTNVLPDDVIYNVAIYADDTALYSKCDSCISFVATTRIGCKLWTRIGCELKSDLQDTVDWGRKWLVDFIAGKNQLDSFDWSNNTGAIDVRMDESVLEEKSSFNMLGLTFSSKLD